MLDDVGRLERSFGFQPNRETRLITLLFINIVSWQVYICSFNNAIIFFLLFK